MSTAPLCLSNVTSFVPHRGSMCLVHRLLEADEQHALAEVDVPAQGPFTRPEGVPAWVGLEYMAQTVAAWSGVRARRNGGLPRNGYLLGTRRFEARIDHFAPGQTLRVRIQCELIAGNGLGQFACRITDPQDRTLAEAMVSVYEPPAPRPPITTSHTEENP